MKVITEEIWGLSQLPFHAPARGIFALCHGMFLDVGIGPKDLAQKIGLSQTEVIAAAEARLRSARLYRDAGDQALSISVNLGEDVFSVEVALKRAVRDLGYTIGGVMTVWETSYIGSYSSSEIILSALSRSLDSFLASYLRINDVACKLPPQAFDPFAPEGQERGRWQRLIDHILQDLTDMKSDNDTLCHIVEIGGMLDPRRTVVISQKGPRRSQEIPGISKKAQGRNAYAVHDRS